MATLDAVLQGLQGALNKNPAVIEANQVPDAEEAPEMWAVLWVGRSTIPGLVDEIDGERKRDVDHKKSKGSSRDLLIDQGMEPSEVTITIRTVTAQEWRDLYYFAKDNLNPDDRPLSRANVVDVFHPRLYVRGIKQGYFFAADVPKPTHKGGIYPMLHTFRMKVVGPKTQISANSSSSKPAKKGTWDKPTDPSHQIAGGNKPGVGWLTTDPNLLPGVQNQSKAPPLVEKPVLYTPAQISKISKAGDPTAQFLERLNTQAVPK